MSVKKLTIEQIMEAVESGDYVGFCRACGEQAEGIEPDARGYKCESCGKNQVYGAEELLMMYA
jgi:tRNA(Ile2) C34 agmatinyltransferase TiaS